MPPPHADNTAFVVVPSPAATASAMVTDELRVRLAVREGAASRAREAALSGEAVALAALDRRADGWRALAPAEIRALAAAAASMRERLLAAGVPDEHDDATLKAAAAAMKHSSKTQASVAYDKRQHDRNTAAALAVAVDYAAKFPASDGRRRRRAGECISV